MITYRYQSHYQQHSMKTGLNCAWRYVYVGGWVLGVYNVYIYVMHACTMSPAETGATTWPLSVSERRAWVFCAQYLSGHVFSHICLCMPKKCPFTHLSVKYPREKGACLLIHCFIHECMSPDNDVFPRSIESTEIAIPLVCILWLVLQVFQGLFQNIKSCLV